VTQHRLSGFMGYWVRIMPEVCHSTSLICATRIKEQRSEAIFISRANKGSLEIANSHLTKIAILHSLQSVGPIVDGLQITVSRLGFSHLRGAPAYHRKPLDRHTSPNSRHE